MEAPAAQGPAGDQAVLPCLTEILASSPQRWSLDASIAALWWPGWAHGTCSFPRGLWAVKMALALVASGRLQT